MLRLVEFLSEFDKDLDKMKIADSVRVEMFRRLWSNINWEEKHLFFFPKLQNMVNTELRFKEE